MKKIDLGQSISILANIGVIAGIVFLAVELQQNNELLSAQARSERVSLRQADTALLIQTPELVTAVLKHQRDEQLTDYEELIFSNYLNFIFTNFENVYMESQRGLIEEDSIPVDSWRSNFHGSGDFDMLEYWNAQKVGFQPRFVEWMEENIIYVTQ